MIKAQSSVTAAILAFLNCKDASGFGNIVHFPDMKNPVDLICYC